MSTKQELRFRSIVAVLAALLFASPVALPSAAAAGGPGTPWSSNASEYNMPAGCSNEFEVLFPDTADENYRYTDGCYHMKADLNALDSPKIDVLIMAPVSPWAERDLRAVDQVIAMYDQGFDFLAREEGMEWLADGVEFHVSTDIRDLGNANLGEFTTYPIVDPEIVVIVANPVVTGVQGIGIDPVDFGGELVDIMLGDGFTEEELWGPVECRGFAGNPFDHEAWENLPGYDSHHDGRGGTYVEDCGGDGGNICFAYNHAIDPIPGVVEDVLGMSTYDLVAHEVGHCLRLGHVGDAGDHQAVTVPYADIMSYTDQVAHKCVSTLDLELFAVAMSSYLDVNDDGVVDADDQMFANDRQPLTLDNTFQVQHPHDHYYASHTGWPNDCPQPDLGLVPLGAQVDFTPVKAYTEIVITSPSDGSTAPAGPLTVEGAVLDTGVRRAVTPIDVAAIEDSEDDALTPLTEVLGFDAELTASTLEVDIRMGMLTEPTGTASPLTYTVDLSGYQFESFILFPGFVDTWDPQAPGYLDEGTTTWDYDTSTVSFHLPRSYLDDTAGLEFPLRVSVSAGYGVGVGAQSPDWAPNDPVDGPMIGSPTTTIETVVLSAPAADPVDITDLSSGSWSGAIDLAGLAGTVPVTATWLDLDGSVLGMQTIDVVLEGDQNAPPVADAGADQTVDEGAVGVSLDGSGSTDDTAVASHAWSQTSGPTVVLAGDQTAVATFDAPFVDADTTLTFQLAVFDDEGLSATDSIDVLVRDTTVTGPELVITSPDNDATIASPEDGLAVEGTFDPDAELESERQSSLAAPQLDGWSNPGVGGTGDYVFIDSPAADTAQQGHTVLTGRAGTSDEDPNCSVDCTAPPCESDCGFVDDSHVVIAMIDTGGNPYHREFRDAARLQHPSEYLSGFPASTPAANLCFIDADGSYNDDCVGNVKTEWGNDNVQFPAVTPTGQTGAGQGDLVWFPGTRLMGISFAHTDGGGAPATVDLGAAPQTSHGSWVSATAVGATKGDCPECLLVIIEADTVEGIDAAHMWAANQPWIDVITSSVSIGVIGVGVNPALFYGKHDAAMQASQNGKVFITAAGNGAGNAGIAPTSTFLLDSSSPAVIGVGASTSANLATHWSDFPAQIMGTGSARGSAAPASYNAPASVSGTSFSAPSSAGVLADALLQARKAVGDNEEGATASGGVLNLLRNKERLAVDDGPFKNGVLTRDELEEAFLKNADPAYMQLSTIPGPVGWAKNGYGGVNAGADGINAGGTTIQAKVTDTLLGARDVPVRPLEQWWVDHVIRPVQEQQWGASKPVIDGDGDGFPRDDGGCMPDCADGEMQRYIDAFAGISARSIPELRDAIEAVGLDGLAMQGAESSSETFYMHRSACGGDDSIWMDHTPAPAAEEGSGCGGINTLDGSFTATEGTDASYAAGSMLKVHVRGFTLAPHPGAFFDATLVADGTVVATGTSNAAPSLSLALVDTPCTEWLIEVQTTQAIAEDAVLTLTVDAPDDVQGAFCYEGGTEAFRLNLAGSGGGGGGGGGDIETLFLHLDGCGGGLEGYLDHEEAPGEEEGNGCGGVNAMTDDWAATEGTDAAYPAGTPVRASVQGFTLYPHPGVTLSATLLADGNIVGTGSAGPIESTSLALVDTPCVEWAFDFATTQAISQGAILTFEVAGSADTNGAFCYPGGADGPRVELEGVGTLDDEDGDGVSDAQDDCPGTAAGTPVDAQGCPLSPTGSVAFTVNGQGAGFVDTTDGAWIHTIDFDGFTPIEGEYVVVATFGTATETVTYRADAVPPGPCDDLVNKIHVAFGGKASCVAYNPAVAGTWGVTVDGYGPLAPGEHTVTATAYGVAGAVLDQHTIMVQVAPDLSPTADAGADETAPEGASVALTGTCTGDGTVTCTWSQVAGPGVVLSDDGVGRASFTAPLVAADTALMFRLQAEDAAGQTASDEVLITVLDVNRPPVLSVPGKQTVREGDALAFEATATDADGDAPVLEAVDLPEGATFDAGGFAWTPGFDQAGEYQVGFTASDGEAMVTATVRIVVLNTDRAPILTVVAPAEATAGEAVEFVFSAVDPDGTTPLLSMAAGPSTASVRDHRDGTATFSWIPGHHQAGSQTIRLAAYSHGMTTQQEFSIDVLANPYAAGAAKALPRGGWVESEAPSDAAFASMRPSARVMSVQGDAQAPAFSYQPGLTTSFVSTGDAAQSVPDAAGAVLLTTSPVQIDSVALSDVSCSNVRLTLYMRFTADSAPSGFAEGDHVVALDVPCGGDWSTNVDDDGWLQDVALVAVQQSPAFDSRFAYGVVTVQ